MAQSVIDPQQFTPLTPSDLARKNLEFGKKVLEGGDVRRATRYLEVSIEQEPSGEALNLLAQIELDRPDLQRKALEHLKLAVTVAPQNTTSWLLLAGYWAARGETAKQRRCLEKITAYDPANAEALSALKEIGQEG